MAVIFSAIFPILGALTLCCVYSHPQKLILFLRVVSKRPDGYHHLSSIFQTISLGDILTIDLHAQDEFTCTDPSLSMNGSNLISKAISLFRYKTGCKQCFKVHLTKRIPIQAGLGGGSSNAATTLWACNQLTNTKASIADLKQWSGEIGSDIPFFFSHGTAHCTGRGEIVRDLPNLPIHSLWVVKPSKGLSTPEVYHRLNFTDSLSAKIVQEDLDSFLSGCLPYFNDLEKPALEIEPELYRLKTSLLKGGFEGVLMSGSGSAFFCLGQGVLPKHPHLTFFSAHYIHRSPSSWYKEVP